MFTHVREMLPQINKKIVRWIYEGNEEGNL